MRLSTYQERRLDEELSEILEPLEMPDLQCGFVSDAISACIGALEKYRVLLQDVKDSFEQELEDAIDERDEARAHLKDAQYDLSFFRQRFPHIERGG